MTCDVLFTFHHWVCAIGSQSCSLNKTLMASHFLRMNYQKISHCTRQLNTLPEPVFTVFFNIVTSHWEDRLISMQQTINFMYIEPLRSISLPLSLTVCVCVWVRYCVSECVPISCTREVNRNTWGVWASSGKEQPHCLLCNKTKKRYISCLPVRFSAWKLKLSWIRYKVTGF